eukprot:TRINITY_DN11411_c0_g1_i1.p2 TRINITY_DN11411_c0_g1~~TRINITY_DN11411_c0_g1_i1.p2  ORF type:complete len:136 (-),score=7.85 TRINITY_DN11411_c0_g1_i1:1316-1723(-)
MNDLSCLFSLSDDPKYFTDLIKIEKRSLKEVQLLYQVYVDLYYVKKWKELKIEYNDISKKYYMIGYPLNSDMISIIIPILSYTTIKFQELLNIVNSFNDNSLTIALQDSDSSISYVSLYSGLISPLLLSEAEENR